MDTKPAPETPDPATPGPSTPAEPGTTGGATPPGGGRQDHAAMRAAAMWPIAGPAATGADAPGTVSERPERIPGEHDSTTLTRREPGAMSGQFNGADSVSAEDGSGADDVTREEWARDGGGAPAERRAGRRAGQRRAREHGPTGFEPR